MRGEGGRCVRVLFSARVSARMPKEKGGPRFRELGGVGRFRCPNAV